MQFEDPGFLFKNATQYAFLYENAHLLLVVWDREHFQQLFLIGEQGEDGKLMLDYPGQTYTERVLDMIQNIFFIQVQEGDAEGKRYVLGSYFEVQGKTYGAFYERDSMNPDVVLFRIDGESPDFTLEVLEGDELQRVTEAFAAQHEDLVSIRATL